MTLPSINQSDLTPRRASSPLTRACLVAYLFLIVYASWFPFSGWQVNSLTTIGDVIRQWPHYWSGFDVGINIVGYMPLGALLVFAGYPHLRGAWAVLVSILLSAAISASMEMGQYFLPNRVTSLLDFITNTSGASLGAFIGWRLVDTVLENHQLELLQQRWLRQESSRQLVVLGLWPLAQIYPQPSLFGLGQILPTISAWLEDYLDLENEWGDFLRHGIALNAEQFFLSETLITACSCTGALLICLSLLNRHAPQFWLSLLLLGAALCLKSLASAVMFLPEHAFIWLTPGAIGGLFISFVMLYGFSFTPHHVQRRLAFGLLLTSLILVNLVPDNPYFIETMQSWPQGKFLNFYGAAQCLAVLWPWLALRYLIVRSSPAKP